jgi:hypothetical protein
LAFNFNMRRYRGVANAGSQTNDADFVAREWQAQGKPVGTTTLL